MSNGLSIRAGSFFPLPGVPSRGRLSGLQGKEERDPFSTGEQTDGLSVHLHNLFANTQSKTGPLAGRMRLVSLIKPIKDMGLIGLKDRVEALSGRLEVSSPPGAGTALSVRIPLAS